VDAEGPRAAPAKGLTAAALSGMSWSYSTSILIAIVQVFYVGVMSRLLSPRAFGLYAIALLAMNAGNTFAGMGVAQALIQKPEVTRDDIRAAATSGVGLGLLFFGSLWALAPWIAGFFTEPDAVPVLRVMGLHFLFLGFGLTAQALQRRAHRFRQVAISQCVAMVIGYGIVGPVAAQAGAGVWSLCAAVLTSHFLEAGIDYAWVRHPLRPLFARRAFRDLYGFGARISFHTLLEYLGKQLDTFAVGRYASTALLGQYTRAFVLVSLPLSQHLRQAITRVMFPGFSRIQGDTQRLTRAYLSVVTLIGTLMLGVAAGMAVAAREIVLVILGGQWDVAIRLVPFFAVAVVLNVMTRFSELVCQAKARLNALIALQSVYLVLLGLAYVAVSEWPGVLPFAVALAVSEILRHLAFTWLLRRLTGLRFGDVAMAYAPAITTAACVAALVYLGRLTLHIPGVPLQVVLAVEMVCGGIALALGIRFNPFRRVRDELFERMIAAGLIGKRRSWKTRAAMLLVGNRPLPTAAAPTPAPVDS
jgi:O-antigen/teichoic acid export membrane protein